MFRSKLERLLLGETVPGCNLQWRSNDKDNVGPYLIQDGREPEILFLYGFCWLPEGTIRQTYGGVKVREFFDRAGRYMGPDWHGVYPVLK